ncbi:MAG: NFACT RNA binding domain-containing protein, partial [Candidatus Altiarchaeota archaeon]|nr:NFACT RNA binding domain-containing protein [Candidatus Altiarchaeota archaeon]
MKFRIDIRKSVPENAEYYYSESKKAKHKVAGARKALGDTQKKISELKRRQEASVSEYMPERKRIVKKKWYEKFHWFHSSDNFLVVGGKDATTNEILVKKYLDNHDLVFHADIHGAPFFVVKNPDKKEIPESTLMEVAYAAASYSKAWKLGLGSCDVYCVNPGQVSKKAPSGEYLGKGAFMIHGKKQWFRGTRLEMAVGFRVNDEVEVICGPVGSVESNSSYSVKITSGDRKSGELAKEIKEVILKKTRKDDAEKIRKIRLEDIQKHIPGGKGRIL